MPLWPVLPKTNRWVLPRSKLVAIRAPQKEFPLWFGPKYRSGTEALLVVETRRSAPDPVTPSVVPEEFTMRLSVPADSAKALAATLSGLVAEKLIVPNDSVPAFTAVVPE